ncbi:hypothetical protein L596_016062 [Steinernema carpocapsae]|uniref:Uncharacterized protein n=1 Tax=Steinernema carpocapsae TaxID=34508 RepID=A0A4U5NI32_STECR|nr:hypothetical protein L596_016062 [Steinernema carpocapsae]
MVTFIVIWSENYRHSAPVRPHAHLHYCGRVLSRYHCLRFAVRGQEYEHIHNPVHSFQEAHKQRRNLHGNGRRLHYQMNHESPFWEHPEDDEGQDDAEDDEVELSLFRRRFGLVPDEDSENRDVTN